MLQFIRNHAQGVIAWIIVAIIIIPFMLWGINQYFQADPEVYVAKVNDAKIMVPEYQRVYQRERAFRQSLMGKNFNPAMLDDPSIKRDALDRLINTEVMTQSAVAAGFRVSDLQLSQQIREEQQFQRDGQFDQEIYTNLLSSQGMPPGKFEQDLRRDMLANQLVAGVNETALATDNEIDYLLKIKEQQRKIGYMVVKAADFSKDVEVTDDEINRYYEEHQNNYMLPEQVSIEYIELDAKQMQRDARADEETLRKMYDDQLASFARAEERKARHILIKVEEGVSEDEVEKAKAKAEDLLKRIRAGESFEELAKKNSEDAGSAESGGDLGFFGRGVMVKPFEDTVFSMETGQVSDVVRSPFGFHIIKLEETKSGDIKPFDEVRAKLEEDFRDQRAQEQFFDQAEILTNLAYEHPKSLATAAEELGLEIKTSGLFNRDSGQGLATNPKIREAAFSTDVLEAGNNSEPLDVGTNHLAVIRIKEHKPLSYKTVEQVRELITAQLKREGAQAKAAETGKEILARVSDKGEAIDVLAKEFKLEWKKTDLIKRDDSSIDRNIVNAAFKLEKPTKEQTMSTDGSALPSGDYAIIAVYEAKDGDSSAVEESTRESLATSVSRNEGRALSMHMLESFKKKARIIEYPDKL